MNSKPLPTIAVVAHSGKTMGGGLGELREMLAARGFERPLWFEIERSKKAPKRIAEALHRGADLIFVWGGDGTVQRAVDALAGSTASLAILPAGTANLLAGNLGIPKDLAAAVAVGLDGVDRTLDLGRANGECFAVMAGTGFDADIMRATSKRGKERFGRAAYVVNAARGVRNDPVATTIRVDGHSWFKGDATCVLVGNVGDILGGITAFDHARPDDGLLDVAVVTASGAWQWTKTLVRAAANTIDGSTLVRSTVGSRIDIRTRSPRRYELDGGVRPKSDRLVVKVLPAAINVRVPAHV